MINNGYQGLQWLLSSFTRAASAAERVLTLMDSLPDINLNDGKDPGILQGKIEIKNLKFTYKTRPDQPVLQV